MATGAAKWLNADKGFGFIAQDDGGADVLVHFTAIQSEAPRAPAENDRVSFDVIQGPEGPQSEDVKGAAPSAVAHDSTPDQRAAAFGGPSSGGGRPPPPRRSQRSPAAPVRL
ncbi:cold-shock protein [Streptomyces laculatispora]|nr:cold-shock protein [Streptomyces laculatispora]